MRRHEIPCRTREHAQTPKHQREPNEAAARLAQLAGEALEVDPSLARGLGKPPQSIRKLRELLQGEPEKPEHRRRHERNGDADPVEAVESVVREPRGYDDGGEGSEQPKRPNGAGDGKDESAHGRDQNAYLDSAPMRAPSQRRALGALFSLIAIFFVGIAVTAFEATQDEPLIWVIVIAAGALALWMGSMAFRALSTR